MCGAQPVKVVGAELTEGQSTTPRASDGADSMFMT